MMLNLDHWLGFLLTVCLVMYLCLRFSMYRSSLMHILDLHRLISGAHATTSRHQDIQDIGDRDDLCHNARPTKPVKACARLVVDGCGYAGDCRLDPSASTRC